MNPIKVTTVAIAALTSSSYADFESLMETYPTDNKVAAEAETGFMHMNDRKAPMLGKGTREIGVSGNLNFADDFAYNLNLSYGYFIKNRWEIGFAAGIQGIESDYNLSLGLFTEYNFCVGSPDSKWVPYVGFSASWASLDSDAFSSDSIALGLDLGIKYFIRENIAISFSVGATYAFDDVFPGEDDFAQQVNIGTRFYF